MMNKKRTAFLIIPCAKYYQRQAEAIKELCKIADLEPVVAEERSSVEREDVLNKIKAQIMEAEIVIIELLPDNFNISFEAGIVEKTEHLIGKRRFLVANYINDFNIIPSDIRGREFIQYSTLKDLLMKLGIWLAEIAPNIGDERKGLIRNYYNVFKLPTIFEDFKDFNRLRDTWMFGMEQIDFVKEGLKLTNAHFPIHTKLFSRFHRYKLNIRARIDRRCLGIALHVQRSYKQSEEMGPLPFPDLCIMFNFNEEGACIPHILIKNILHKRSHYWIPEECQKCKVDLKRDADNFFELEIKVNENIIIIQGIEFDLLKINYSQFKVDDCMAEQIIDQREFERIFHEGLKQLNHGDIGLRCHPDNEEATINSLSVSFD